MIVNLQHDTHKWSDINDVVFQAIAHDKCVVSLLSYKEKRGRLVIDYDTIHELELEDYQGAKTKIRYAKPNEPNVGLGYT